MSTNLKTSRTHVSHFNKFLKKLEFNFGSTACELIFLKFIYSEKATKFCEIFTLLLTGTTLDKSKANHSVLEWI